MGRDDGPAPGSSRWSLSHRLHGCASRAPGQGFIHVAQGDVDGLCQRAGRPGTRDEQRRAECRDAWHQREDGLRSGAWLLRLPKGVEPMRLREFEDRDYPRMVELRNLWEPYPVEESTVRDKDGRFPPD